MSALSRDPSGLPQPVLHEKSDKGQSERSRALVALLAGRWTLAVIDELAEGGRRYQDVHDALDGISHKVLTDTLRRAERDGIVARRLDSGRMETATLYELTDMGRSLDVPLEALARWVDANWRRVEVAQRRWNQLRRGERLNSVKSPRGRAFCVSVLTFWRTRTSTRESPSNRSKCLGEQVRSYADKLECCRLAVLERENRHSAGRDLFDFRAAGAPVGRPRRNRQSRPTESTLPLPARPAVQGDGQEPLRVRAASDHRLPRGTAVPQRANLSLSRAARRTLASISTLRIETDSTLMPNGTPRRRQKDISSSAVVSA